MIMEFVAIVMGLALLVWSADKFVDGAAITAKYLGMSPLFIGMVIVGFGTSLPEMIVSTISSLQGNPGLALGNAYGSNITNIAMILGVTAMITPISVHSQVLRKELPILLSVTVFTILLLVDGQLSSFDAILLLITFFAIMIWSTWQSRQNNSKDDLDIEVAQELVEKEKNMSLKMAMFWTIAGLVLLIISSRALVWGAVGVAHFFGVSDLIIGLTILAVGTSLPEFASSVMAARKGEDDIALGNIIGSNFFNTLAVVGIAGTIHPMPVEDIIIKRDLSAVLILTMSLFIFGHNYKREPKISKRSGFVLLLSYVAYTTILMLNIN